MFGCSSITKFKAFSALILATNSGICISSVFSHSKQSINLLESLLHHGACWACAVVMIQQTIHELHRYLLMWYASSLVMAHDFIIDPLFPSIFCQSLSGHIRNINPSIAISHPLTSLVWTLKLLSSLPKALFKKAIYSSSIVVSWSFCIVFCIF